MKTLGRIYLVILVVLNVNTNFLNAQVVINEVMANPSGAQGLIVFNGSSGNEYIELYNPSCSPVDVTGYYLADRQDFSGTISGGAFRIPAVPEAIIQPNGHLVIGTSTSSSDANSVDIKIPSFIFCQNSASRNFILANADGWIALYDASGKPIDAIYWSSSAGNITSKPDDFGGVPCIPSSSPAGVFLESAQQINAIFPGVLQYAGPNPSPAGKTFSRIPDGGTWTKDVPPSINNSTGATNCNGGTCVTPVVFGMNSTVVQPTCGNPNGSITLTPKTAGTYTYTWTPNVSTSSTASNLSAATYLISIDKGGCKKDTTITLVSGSGPTAVATTPTNPSCGASNGQVVIGNVTGGVGAIEYNFNGQGYSATKTYTGLAANSYTLLVKDANGCIYTAPNVVLTSGSGPTAVAITTTNPDCGQSNGQVDIGLVTGGTLPYTYNFNSLGFPASSQTYSNLSAGSYTLIVQDANGCNYTAPNIVLTSANGPTAIAVTTTNTGCGAPTGQVDLGLVTGGTSPYQYNFNGLGFPASSQTYSNLSAGSYSLIVQDANGCTYTAPNIVVTSATGPTAIAVTTTNTGCGAPTGKVDLGLVTGGTSPYQYNFNGLGFPASSQTYSNLSAGSYSLIVQDANGCSYTAPNIVLTSATGPTAIQNITKNASCSLANGEVGIGLVTGGTSPYRYNFNGLGFPASSQTYSNLSAGSYTLIVQDANGCTYSAPNIVLTSENGPTAIAVTTKNESCSLANGEINLGIVTGGTLPYKYNFNGLGFAASSVTYLNLTAGSYSLIVQDANGCSYTAPSIVLSNTSGPTSVAVSTTNSTCNLSNGSILIGSATGGLAPYEYNFNSLGYSTGKSFLNLAASSYTLSVKDANGCIYLSTPILVSNTSGPFDLTLSAIDASCEKKNGEIEITNTSGGIIPYSYSIDGISFSNSTNFTDLSQGNYNITVKDANGCIYSESQFIVNNPSPIANFSFYPYLIKNEKQDISLTDQSAGNSLSYQWFIPDGFPSLNSTKNFSAKLLNFEEGLYPITLIITDKYGCIDSITKYIERRIDPIIYIPNTFTPDGDTYNNLWEYSLNGLDLSSFSMRVFNRWGTVVWETNDQYASWDGKYKGELVQTGTYTWTMTAKDNVEDKRFYLNGNLNVIY